MSESANGSIVFCCSANTLQPLFSGDEDTIKVPLSVEGGAKSLFAPENHGVLAGRIFVAESEALPLAHVSVSIAFLCGLIELSPLTRAVAEACDEHDQYLGSLDLVWLPNDNDPRFLLACWLFLMRERKAEPLSWSYAVKLWEDLLSDKEASSFRLSHFLAACLSEEIIVRGGRGVLNYNRGAIIDI